MASQSTVKKLETGSSWIPCQLPGFSPAAAAGGCGHRPPRAPKPRPAAGGHARAPLSCGAGGPALPPSPPRVISRHPHLTRFSPVPALGSSYRDGTGRGWHVLRDLCDLWGHVGRLNPGPGGCMRAPVSRVSVGELGNIRHCPHNWIAACLFLEKVWSPLFRFLKVSSSNNHQLDELWILFRLRWSLTLFSQVKNS